MKKANKLDVIGPKTSVSFRKIGILNVPAKVDTGADSSSVWASEISELNGVLSFELFDARSPWHNGKKISTKQYQIKSIKNSFGISEFRYKVVLNVEINGKKIKAKFTLSDRSNNRYPILIGRKTLKNRFLVDVSDFNADKNGKKVNKNKNILVLLSRPNPKIDEFFTHAQKKYSSEYIFKTASYNDLTIIIEKNKLWIKLGTEDLSNFDLIYLMTRVKDAEKAAIVANYAKYMKIPFVDIAAGFQPTDAKMYQLALLAMSKVKVPDTIQLSGEKWKENYKLLKDMLGLPFVFKDDSGLKGRDNYLITDKKEFMRVLNDPKVAELQMIAQKYIETDGYYRLLVFGTGVELGMFRSVDQNKSHLYKRSRNGVPKKIELNKLPSEVIKSAIYSAIKLNINIAGVDIVKDSKSGTWYVLEVNNSPQIGTGAFTDEKLTGLVNYFKEEIEK